MAAFEGKGKKKTLIKIERKQEQCGSSDFRMLNGAGIVRNKSGKTLFPASSRKFLILYFQWGRGQGSWSYVFQILKKKWESKGVTCQKPHWESQGWNSRIQIGNSCEERVWVVWAAVPMAKKKREDFKENVLEAKEIERGDPEEGWVHQLGGAGVVSDTENTDVRAPDVACLFEQHTVQHPPLMSVGRPPWPERQPQLPARRNDRKAFQKREVTGTRYSPGLDSCSWATYVISIHLYVLEFSICETNQ